MVHPLVDHANECVVVHIVLMSSISIVIPTRNRGIDVALAARAVLNDPCDLELVVVDQSTNDDSWVALAEVDDPRLIVIRSTETGISNARNTGVAATSAPIVAFTDDDCRPVSGWATAILSVFKTEPDTSLVFGRVVLPPTEEGDFAPAFEPSRRIVQGRAPLPRRGIGIGANFAVRRTALERLGGFDPLLGAGAPCYRGAEETDIVLRALAHGMRIANVTECEVLHLGVRRGPEVRDLIVAYRRAEGAAFGKYVRICGWPGIRDLGRWIGFECGVLVADALRLRRPQPGALLHLVAGAAGSLRYGVNRRAQRLVVRRHLSTSNIA